MNKTVVFITYAVLVALGLIGTVLLLIVAPQHFGTFTGFVVVLLGLATSTAANFWQLGKAKEQIQEVRTETSEKLDIVQRQTNGTLTKLTDRLEEKNDIIAKQALLIADFEAALLHNPKKGLAR